MKKRLKTMLIMLVPLLLGWFVRSYLGSYSFFSDNNISSLNVTAADQKDIIKNIDISNINPVNIMLTKADALNYNPVIYFGVDGQIKEYIRHINPIKLNEAQKSEYIVISINSNQFLDLINSQGNENIKGSICIKHLNEYIDTSIDIEFTRLYLVNEYLKSVGINQVTNLEDTEEIDRVMYKIKMLFENGEEDEILAAQKAVEDYEKAYIETLEGIEASKELEVTAYQKVGVLFQGQIRAELEERILVRSAIIEMVKENLQNNQTVSQPQIMQNIIENTQIIQNDTVQTNTSEGIENVESETTNAESSLNQDTINQNVGEDTDTSEQVESVNQDTEQVEMNSECNLNELTNEDTEQQSEIEVDNIEQTEKQFDSADTNQTDLGKNSNIE